MHYYPHHIGDFTRETAQLTDRQAMSYLRLLWTYYETEQPLPDRPDLLAFKIGGDEREVRLILESYFELVDGQWRHTRCEREIAAYRKRAEASAKGAKARWSNARAMPEHSPSNADATKVDANQEPRTKNQVLDAYASCHRQDDDDSREVVEKPKNGPPDCPYEKLVDLFHERCPLLGRVQVLTAQRKAMLRQRWREVWKENGGDEQSLLAWFEEFFTEVAGNKFLMGGVGGKDGRVWQANFDWLIKPINFIKVVEGRYL